MLQNQVATLLQVKSCHADASQIQRLTQALVQKEGEVKMLNTKISALEKQKVTSKYYYCKSSYDTTEKIASLWPAKTGQSIAN